MYRRYIFPLEIIEYDRQTRWLAIPSSSDNYSTGLYLTLKMPNKCSAYGCFTGYYRKEESSTPEETVAIFKFYFEND